VVHALQFFQQQGTGARPHAPSSDEVNSCPAWRGRGSAARSFRRVTQAGSIAIGGTRKRLGSAGNGRDGAQFQRALISAGVAAIPVDAHTGFEWPLPAPRSVGPRRAVETLLCGGESQDRPGSWQAAGVAIRDLSEQGKEDATSRRLGIATSDSDTGQIAIHSEIVLGRNGENSDIYSPATCFTSMFLLF
jgi:hypothetical protein